MLSNRRSSSPCTASRQRAPGRDGRARRCDRERKPPVNQCRQRWASDMRRTLLLFSWFARRVPQFPECGKGASQIQPEAGEIQQEICRPAERDPRGGAEFGGDPRGATQRPRVVCRQALHRISSPQSNFLLKFPYGGDIFQAESKLAALRRRTARNNGRTFKTERIRPTWRYHVVFAWFSFTLASGSRAVSIFGRCEFLFNCG